ncbi:hypothetical protein [Commensalibacter communis]|uniref:hypothetical protein n=1 Tax=Commensalibacter communis TaxID=2972786 RepID=UPI0022FF827A|nr:hypothetical protein [Commensalibacter communis]CAI3947921.1 unnamed protein product [Commensalibacter communis]CAI3948167.1 unnamed protein product [Commensalibacter communis]
MRKQNIILTSVLALCLVVVLGVWLMVRKELKPVTFPPVVNAELIVGPLHKKRLLTPDELKVVKDWIQKNEKGWGPLHRNPPSTGDVEIQFNQNIDLKDYADKPKDQQPRPFTLVLWLGISQADWNNKVFYEVSNQDGSKVFLKTCEDEEFAPLRKLVDQYDYQRTLFP